MSVSNRALTLLLLLPTSVTTAFSSIKPFGPASVFREQQIIPSPDDFFEKNPDGTSVVPPSVGSGVWIEPGETNPSMRKNDFVNFEDVGYAAPLEGKIELVQGGQTVRTYQMPPWAERVQYLLATNGRPLKAKVELWIGPLRTVHQLHVDNHDGLKTSYQGSVKFKPKAAPCLKIFSSDTFEFPLIASVFVPAPDKSKELMANYENVWENCTPQEKQTVQGGSVEGGDGAVRYWQVPPGVKEVQVLAWSRDTGKKSLRITLDVLQGPNTKKQTYLLQCGGGTQPYQSIIQTPGNGCVILVRNKKFVEDGLVNVVVKPTDGFPIFQWQKTKIPTGPQA